MDHVNENERFNKEQELLEEKRQARQQKADRERYQQDVVGKAIAQVLQTPAWEQMEQIFLDHFAGAYADLRRATREGKYTEAAYAEATLSVLEGIYSDISDKISLGEKAYKQYLGQIFKKVSGDPAQEV